jgi:hypothetical protein
MSQLSPVIAPFCVQLYLQPPPRGMHRVILLADLHSPSIVSYLFVLVTLVPGAALPFPDHSSSLNVSHYAIDLEKANRNHGSQCRQARGSCAVKLTANTQLRT